MVGVGGRQVADQSQQGPLVAVHEGAEARRWRARRERPLILHRAGNEGDQQRHLARRQLGRVLAEVASRGRAQPVDTGAPLDHVEIDLEDPLLAERGVEQQGERHLLQLAAEPLLTREEEVLGELLRDRGRAAGGGAAAPIGEDGRRHLGEIDAVMPEEPRVFTEQQRPDEQRWHLAQGDEVRRGGRDVDGTSLAVRQRDLVHEVAAQPLDRRRHAPRRAEVEPLLDAERRGVGERAGHAGRQRGGSEAFLGVAAADGGGDGRRGGRRGQDEQPREVDALGLEGQRQSGIARHVDERQRAGERQPIHGHAPARQIQPAPPAVPGAGQAKPQLRRRPQGLRTLAGAIERGHPRAVRLEVDVESGRLACAPQAQPAVDHARFEHRHAVPAHREQGADRRARGPRLESGTGAPAAAREREPGRGLAQLDGACPAIVGADVPDGRHEVGGDASGNRHLDRAQGHARATEQPLALGTKREGGPVGRHRPLPGPGHAQAREEQRRTEPDAYRVDLRHQAAPGRLGQDAGADPALESRPVLRGRGGQGGGEGQGGATGQRHHAKDGTTGRVRRLYHLPSSA